MGCKFGGFYGCEPGLQRREVSVNLFLEIKIGLGAVPYFIERGPAVEQTTHPPHMLSAGVETKKVIAAVTYSQLRGEEKKSLGRPVND